MSTSLTDNDYQIIASLEAGETPDDISRMTGLSKARIVRLKVKYDKAIIDGTVDQMLDADKLIAINAIRLSKEQFPMLENAIDKVETEMKSGIERLTRLDDQLIATALFANTRLRSLMATANNDGEMLNLISSLCKLREAFFNKNLTQVNIQNNLPGNTGGMVGDFLSDKPN